MGLLVVGVFFCCMMIGLHIQINLSEGGCDLSKCCVSYEPLVLYLQRMSGMPEIQICDMIKRNESDVANIDL